MDHAAERSSRRVLLTGLLIALAIGGLSCSDESDIGPGGVVAVRVLPDTLHVVLGTVDTISAFPLDADNAFLPRRTVRWSSADDAIASIDDHGVVTANAVGTVEVTATVSGVSDVGVIVVDSKPSMNFNPDTARITAIAGSATGATTSDTVANAGGGSLSALTLDSITYPTGATGWLQADLTSTSAPAVVDLTANASALGLGQSRAAVWFTSPDATPNTAFMLVELSAVADVASNVASFAGDAQTATVATAVATAPAVRVTDQFGNPVAGVAVSFSTTGGSIAGANPTTNANGVAAVTSWTLSNTAGANSLQATVAGLTGSPVNFSATGTAAAPSQLILADGDNQAAIAGTPVTLPPSAKVTDQFGNGVSGVTVSFAVTGGGGSITGPLQPSNASGIAQVGSWTLGITAGVNTLNAISAGLTGSPVTITATGNPGNATTISLSSGNGGSATVGTVLGTPYQVLVTDGVNPVQGVTVGWAAGAGGGSMNPASSLTDASGIASSTRTLGGPAGSQTATATVAGLTGSPVVFTTTANPGTVTQITVNNGNSQSATVNTAVLTDPSALARDAFNNPVPGVAVTFTITAGAGSVNCGAGNTSACNATTAANGVATVTAWNLGTTTGSNTLSATRAGATGTSFTATGLAGAVASVVIIGGNSQTQRPGVALTTDPAVRLRDAFSNLVPFASVTFTVSGGGGTVNCGAGNVSSCSVSANSGGDATLPAWTMGSSGLPTVGQPSLGRYTNNMNATSNGVTTGFTAFAAWSFLSDIKPIFDNNGCVGCHGFSAFGTVVNSTNPCNAASFPSARYIAPSSLANSVIYQKIIPGGSPCVGGARMPVSPFSLLGQTTYDKVRDWILNGAPNN